MLDQKTMQTRCLGGFSAMWVPKLLLTPKKIRIFGPKTANFGPKYAFVVILGEILAFLAHLVPCPTKKKQCEEVPQWFSDIWVPELLLPSNIIRMFCPKTAFFAPKYAFFGT